jgi:hypothetical protein
MGISLSGFRVSVLQRRESDLVEIIVAEDEEAREDGAEKAGESLVSGPCALVQGELQTCRSLRGHWEEE